jgi:uncharacterized protein
MQWIPEPEAAEIPPRYLPQRALPAYRFVPGFAPHPTASPEGHSHGLPEVVVQAFPPAAWAGCESYVFGVDLFNQRYYWEAHESWECVWHACDKARTQGLFVQGLIQVSAALLRWHMGSERGARSLYASAMERLAPARREFPAYFMGVQVEAWCVEVEACFLALPPAGAPRPTPHPRLPVIRLVAAG